jgi:hypothetical protein
MSSTVPNSRAEVSCNSCRIDQGFFIKPSTLLQPISADFRIFFVLTAAITFDVYQKVEWQSA